MNCPLFLRKRSACIISDLHCYPEGYQPAKLVRTVDEILRLNPRPRNVIALGDLAYLTGRPEEYALLKKILAPLEGTGMTLTMAMGNHDRRENFALPGVRESVQARKRAHVVEVGEHVRVEYHLDGFGRSDSPQARSDTRCKNVFMLFHRVSILTKATLEIKRPRQRAFHIFSFAPLRRLRSQAKPMTWLSTLASKLDERSEKSRVSTAWRKSRMSARSPPAWPLSL